jgi:hypothetical protein
MLHDALPRVVTSRTARASCVARRARRAQCMTANVVLRA